MQAVIILIGKRQETALKVQRVLSDNGDIIKTRLGINNELSKDAEAAGFIFLELCGDGARMQSLCEALNGIGDVKAECMTLELPGPGCSCSS